MQGDEPLINGNSIKALGKQSDILNQDSQTIVNGISPLSPDLAFDTNNVKAAISSDHRILYLSRKALKNINSDGHSIFYKQLGLYMFTLDSLNHFAGLPQSPLELSESVELLRWLEAGYTINSCLLDTPSISVDTPEDLLQVEEYLADS